MDEEIIAKHLLVGDTIIDLIKKDADMYYSWQANIAVAFQDEYHRNNKKYKNRKDIHKIANEASKHFLNLLIRK